MIKKYFQFLFLLIILISNLLIGEEKLKEKSFFAICSLRFYIHQLNNQENMISEERIVFEDIDIQKLWQKAESSSSAAEIELAKNYYYQSETSKELREKAKKILDKIWDQYFENYFAESTRDSRKFSSLDTIKRNTYPILEDSYKHILHKLLSPFKVIENRHNFEAEGFNILYTRNDKLIIASHTSLPGYLLKFYFKSPHKSYELEWRILEDRCKGADYVRKLIKEKKLQHFIVPDKWLYILPNEKQAVLLVTDMNIVTTDESRYAWRYKISREHLLELYTILSYGLASPGLPHNIPYTQHGKFACIDTEHPKRYHNYNYIKKYLSKNMKRRWDKIVRSGGKS